MDVDREFWWIQTCIQAQANDVPVAADSSLYRSLN